MYAIGFAIVLVPLGVLGVVVSGGNSGAALAAFLFAAVLLLVVYPAILWVVTAIALLIYNLAAKITGGIEVDVERLQPPAGNWPGYAPGYDQGWSQQGSWPPR